MKNIERFKWTFYVLYIYLFNAKKMHDYNFYFILFIYLYLIIYLLFRYHSLPRVQDSQMVAVDISGRKFDKMTEFRR